MCQRSPQATKTRRHSLIRLWARIAVAGGVTLFLFLLLATAARAQPLPAWRPLDRMGAVACDPEGPFFPTVLPQGTPLPRKLTPTPVTTGGQTPLCVPPMNSPDTATFTGFCAGESQTACDRLAGVFLSWSTQLALALVLVGTLWALTGIFQSGDPGRERGMAAGWMVLLQRLKGTFLVGFLAWRLGSLVQVVETLWQAHTAEAVADSQGTPSLPPVGFVHAAFIVLFLELVQLILFWVVVRLVFASLTGVAALSGLSRRTLGEVLQEHGKWLALLVLTLLLPTLVSAFSAFVFR